MDKIAFVGVGLMGRNMADRLTRSGFSVVAYDIDASSCTLAAQAGVAVAADLAEALRGARFVLTSLPNSAIVREAWLGNGGILSLAEAGAIGIELSTIDPFTMQALAEQAAQRGVRLVDAPVSGGPEEARDGKLVLFTGGEQAVIDAASTILDCLCATRLFTGPVGTGKTVKLVNNMMSMGNIVVAAEAFALGTSAGVEPEVLFDVLSQGGGRSHHFVKRFPRAIKGDFKAGFTMELGEKDVALGIELGRMLHQPTPAASTVREMIALGLAEGRRGQDIVAMLDFYSKFISRDGKN